MVVSKKTRWFFPVETPQDALDAIRIAYQATFAFAGIQAVGISFLIWFAGQWNTSILDPFFMVTLAWSLKTRRSRTAAIVLLLYSVLICFMTLAALVGAPFPGGLGGRNIVLTVLLMYASYKGVQGTSGYHRLIGTSVNVRNLVWLFLATFLYAALYTIVFISLFYVPNVSDKFNQLSDDAVGYLWLVPLVVICFLGGFKRLPGTKSLVVVITTPPLPTESQKLQGYISKHWRGELTLARSYWVNVFLPSIVFTVLYTSMHHSGIFQTNPLLAIQLTVGLLLLSIPLYIWQLGGCWRAARSHIEQTGRLFWARVVQILLVLGAIQATVQWTPAVPALVEYTKIATRTEGFTDYTISVLEDGREGKISGALAFGIDEKFVQTLVEHPGIRLVHLNSSGGRLGPARKLRDLIEKHGLATYTSEQCNSACLLPFMAGRTRTVKSGAKLGFHAYHFPGVQQEEIQRDIETDKAYFVSRGIPQEFLSRAFATGSSTLWFPTQQELISNGVITHTYDGQQLVQHK